MKKTEVILAEVRISKVITEQEINLLKNRSNKLNFDVWDYNIEDVQVTNEQMQKGFTWLVNLYKSPTGKERKNNPFGYREIEVITSMQKGTEKNREDMEQAKRGLEYAEALFKENNIPCKTHLLIRGLTPGEDLVEFAKENNIDEIVVGVKRRSKVGKLLMGSHAQYVILNAHCPVVTVK